MGVYILLIPTVNPLAITQKRLKYRAGSPQRFPKY